MKARGPAIAFLLLLVAFGVSLWQIGARRVEVLEPGVRTLRIGHWQIHTGMREALAGAIADYERLHPDVRILQNPVPSKTWPTWQRAQWTGGSTPDLMQFGRGTTEETVARYYVPLTAFAEEPNPYNAGTPLAGLPWRRTFLDGLGSNMVFFPSLGEVFGIPAQVNTLRLFYNRDLLREVTGSDKPPATLEELLALRPAAEAWRRRTGRTVVPLSLSGPYSELLFDRLSSGMTQGITLGLDPARTLKENFLRVSQGYLDGSWSLDTPAVRRVLELWTEIAALAPPGYLQLPREDGFFNFVTGRALLYYSGSWDYAGIMQEAAFPVGVTTFPQPRPGEGHWGEFSRGRISEAEGGMECILGISRDSRDPALALDFLRFLTSHGSAKKFTALSRRISAVEEIPVPPELETMRPAPGGYYTGLILSQRGNPGGNAVLLFTQNLHLLDARARPVSEAVQAFADALRPAWPDAFARDLAAAPRTRQQIVRQADVRQLFILSAPDRAGASAAFDLIAESALEAELSLAQLRQTPVPRVPEIMAGR